jgi:hypothetical protein
MKALIDADMLRYEVAFGCQYKDEEGEVISGNFDNCIELLDQKLFEIQEEVWGDEPPCLYLTGDDYLRQKLPGCVDKPKNYRVYSATTKKYKGNRKQDKPFHFKNLTIYMLSHYDTKVAWGMEADDLLGIDHLKDPENTIICSRDKDLRMIPGNHFRWQCGKQLGSGPDVISEFDGIKFFYTQMITGDTVDNIPGLPKCGPAKANKTLESCASEGELFKATVDLYKEKIGDGWEDYFKEQADLLWICREEVNGEPKRYEMYG